MKTPLMLLLAFACAAQGSCAAAEKVFGAPVRLEGVSGNGMALDLEGNCLYAGVGDKLVVFDVTEPLSPKRVGSLGGFGAVRQLVVQKGFVYLTARESGFWIVDATTPSAPRLRARFDCCELATGVDVAGDVAFVGQRQNGVEFIDVSDPDHPAHIAMRKTDESQSVKYRDGYLYSGDWGTGRVTVFDCRDMRDIRQVAHEPLWGFGDGLWLKDKYLYCATGHHCKNRDVATLPFKGVDTPEIRKYGKVTPGSGCGHGLDIFDVTDPTKPVRVGRADFPPFYARGLDMWTPRTSGASEIVFTVQTHNGLFAVDCSDKAKPVVLDRWTHPVAKRPDWPSSCLGSVAVGDGCVYVAGHEFGVVAIPARGAGRETFEKGVLPKNASYRETYPTDEKVFGVWRPSRRGQVRAVAVRGDTAYVACGDAGLAVVKIGADGSLKTLAEVASVPTCFDVQVEGDRLYTAEGLRGWAIYRLKDDGLPKLVSRRPRLDAKGRCADPALAVWKPCEGIVGLSTRRNGVDFIRERTFKSGRAIAKVGGCPGWDKYLMDAAIGGGRWIAFNAANSSVKWVDFAATPVKVTETDNNRTTLSCGICRFSDDKAFITKGNGWRFLAPGEGDPADGSQWTFENFPGGGFSGIPRVSPKKRVVLTNRINRRIGLYDFAIPSRPAKLGAWKVSGNPDLAVFYGERLLVPCGYQGLLLEREGAVRKAPLPEAVTSATPKARKHVR